MAGEANIGGRDYGNALRARMARTLMLWHAGHVDLEDALTELELVLTSQQQSQGTVTATEQGRVVLVLDEKAPTLRPYDRVEVRRV